jgi:hypothetical protein
MGRILPFYRTGGVVSGGGGGGGPLGDATVWGSIADWSEFGTIAGPLRNGDRVFVNDLSPGFGYAQYNGADWELVQGFFPTVADLLAFGGGGELIYTTGEAIVGTGDETSVVYYYTGAAWDRMPDGSRFIYPSVPDWASLPTADTVLNNDEVGVDDLGYTGSSGVAQWHAATPEWRLIEGQFTSVADLLAFDALYPVHNLATARVRSTAPFNDRSIVYIHHSGVWTRSGVTTTEGYAWTLTETQLLDGTDPSGIGLVQEGDWGIFAASGGPIVVRYKVVTIAAGTTTGTRAMWIPPAAYAGTNLRLDSFALGTESDAQLVAQGLAVTETNTGTVGTTGGYTDINAPAVGAGNSVAQLTSAVITGAKKFAVMCQIRGAVSSSSGAAGLFQSSAETNTQWSLGAGAAVATTVQQLYWVAAWTLASNTFTARGGASAWPGITSTPWLLMAESGAVISDLVQTRVDGAVYSTYRRNGDSAVDATNYTALLLAVGGTAGTSGRLQVKNYFRLVWD